MFRCNHCGSCYDKSEAEMDPRSLDGIGLVCQECLADHFERYPWEDPATGVSFESWLDEMTRHADEHACSGGNEWCSRQEGETLCDCSLVRWQKQDDRIERFASIAVRLPFCYKSITNKRRTHEN